MNKSILIALLGLVAVASATIVIPMENFLKAVPAHVLMQNLMKPNLQSSATAVKWGTCPDKQVYDVAKGTNSPQPPVVG